MAVEIRQDSSLLSIPTKKENVLINGCVRIHIDTSLLDSDIERINSIEPEMKVSIDTGAKIDEIKEYLYRLKGLLNDRHEAFLNWNFIKDEGIIRCYPIEIKNFPDYNIVATDYIRLDGGLHIARLWYPGLNDVMAFEMMRGDFDEGAMEEIEKELSNIGITGIYDVSNLEKYIELEPYKLSKIFKIESSPYASDGGKIAYDYFGFRRSKAAKHGPYTGGRYLEPVGDSIRMANSIIAIDVLNRLKDEQVFCQLATMQEDGLYLMYTGVPKDKMEKILEQPIIIRCMGRRFEIPAKIIIY